MDQTVALDIARQAILLSLKIALPLLLTTLIIGIVVSVFQAVTQVQELTLTFVPKVLGVVLVFVLLGHWMLSMMLSFVRSCFEHVARVASWT